jgi:hypothetical protein
VRLGPTSCVLTAAVCTVSSTSSLNALGRSTTRDRPLRSSLRSGACGVGGRSRRPRPFVPPGVSCSAECRTCLGDVFAMARPLAAAARRRSRFPAGHRSQLARDRPFRACDSQASRSGLKCMCPRASGYCLSVASLAGFRVPAFTGAARGAALGAAPVLATVTLDTDPQSGTDAQGILRWPLAPGGSDARCWLVSLSMARARSRPRGRSRRRERARAEWLVCVDSHGWRVVVSEKGAE